MGWYSLYKWFIQWSKRPYINRIDWFKHYLYQEWFNSLSEEEQKLELERQEKRRQIREQESLMALRCLGQMYNQLNRMTNGSLDTYRDIAVDMSKMSRKSNKYHN